MMAESGGNPRAYNPTPVMGEHSCVPLSTQALPRRGWLLTDRVRAGAETIGYTRATGRSEWTRITRVLHFEDAEVWRIGNSQWHADVTPNHRWWSDTLTRVQP